MAKKSRKNKPTMKFESNSNNELNLLNQFLKEMDIEVDPHMLEKNRTNRLIDGLNQITDLWVIIAGLLGSQPITEPLLSEIYSKDKVVYHNAREDVFGGKYTPNNFDIHTEIRIQKVLGVLALDKQKGNFANTERLMKVAFKQQYNYCKNRNRISLGDYYKRALEGKKLSSADLHNRGRNASIVALFFFLTEQSFIDVGEGEDATADVKNFVDSIESMDFEPVNKGDVKRDALPKFVEYMFTAFTKSVFRDRDELELADIWGATYDRVAVAESDDYFIANGKIPPYRLTNAFQALLSFVDIPYSNVQFSTLVKFVERFQALGVNKRYFLEQRISKENFESVLKESVYTYMKNTLGEIDFIVYFMDTLAMTILVDDLTVTRNYMLRDGEVEQIQQAKLHLEDASAKDDLIAQLQLQLSRKTTEHEQLIKQVNSNTEVATLRKRVRELERQLEQKDDNTKELFALREFMFNADKQAEYALETINYAEALQNERIVCIGGHDNWIMYMKRVLPNAVFLNADSNGRDYSSIKQPNTTVFVHTAYNNHGTYYKAVAGLKETDNKLYFINNTNVDLILRDMYHKISTQ